MTDPNCESGKHFATVSQNVFAPFEPRLTFHESEKDAKEHARRVARDVDRDSYVFAVVSQHYANRANAKAAQAQKEQDHDPRILELDAMAANFLNDIATGNMSASEAVDHWRQAQKAYGLTRHYRCPSCGEESLYASDDVTLYWNAESQSWDPSDDSSVRDDSTLYCGECDETCEAREAICYE